MNVTLAVATVAVVMMVVEALRPGRRWPQVRGWWLRAIALNAVQVGSVFLAGATCDGWMAGRSPGRHRRWGPWRARSSATSPSPSSTTGGTAARHESPFLWRWLHQVHHSPQRIEIITSFYKHPLEIVVNGVLSSAILYLGVGLGAGGGRGRRRAHRAGRALLPLERADALLARAIVFQRPESHCVHHQEGLHSYNYADLPLWDMLFGTFRNPRRFEARCGFGPRTSTGWARCWRGVDVDAEPTEAAS